MRSQAGVETMEMTAGKIVIPMERPGRIDVRAPGRIGDILIASGVLRANDVNRVLAFQQSEQLRFGEAAVRLGLISPDDLCRAIAVQYWPARASNMGENISPELVVARDPFHTGAEDLRALRTQLLIRWSSAGTQQKILAIVSPGPSEGRSYIAANLSIAFAEIGIRTLLIDADMRAPRQHRIFNVHEPIGLAAFLAGRADRSEPVPLPEFGSLSLLPAGARMHNPQELLSRPALGDLFNQMRQDFDVILLDTPPAKRYADAYGLSFRAGQAMVLARKDCTRHADTANTVRELGDTGARVIGTVLNAF